MKKYSKKTIALLVSCIVLLVAMVGTTIAYLVTSTDPITNTFTPTKVTTTITEDFKDDVKNDVQVKNTGDIDAYIRAAVVVTWQNDAGEVYPTAPAEKTSDNPNGDYTVRWKMDGWVKHTDGYYYYTSKVAAGDPTGILLTECKPVEGKKPEGYNLVVEILASAIQAEPASAVKDAWGVDPTTLKYN